MLPTRADPMPCKRGILLWGTALDKRGCGHIRVNADGYSSSPLIGATQGHRSVIPAHAGIQSCRRGCQSLPWTSYQYGAGFLDAYALTLVVT